MTTAMLFRVCAKESVACYIAFIVWFLVIKFLAFISIEHSWHAVQWLFSLEKLEVYVR